MENCPCQLTTDTEQTGTPPPEPRPTPAPDKVPEKKCTCDEKTPLTVEPPCIDDRLNYVISQNDAIINLAVTNQNLIFAAIILIGIALIWTMK